MIRPFTQAEITAATDAAIADLRSERDRWAAMARVFQKANTNFVRAARNMIRAATEHAEKAKAERDLETKRADYFRAHAASVEKQALRFAEYGEAMRTRVEALEGAAREYRHAMEGFAEAVRYETGKAYPWPAQDTARAKLDSALSAPPAPATVNDPLTVGAGKESLTTAVSQAAADVLADLRATIAKLETPNQYWDAEDPEDSYATDPTDVLDRSGPPPGVAVKLFCSRSLPVEWGIVLPTKLDADGEVEESDVLTFPTEAEAIAAYEHAKGRLDRAAQAEREG